MLEVGQYLQQGRYRIRDRLNQGGMGTVYLAADRNLSNRLVAIKENSDSSAEAQDQFQAEAVILARLTHPNLPRVTDHFIEPSGRQYLVMDYVAGEDLRQLLNKAGGSLPEADVLAWMVQVMDALEYMHSWVDNETGAPSPIIHRDIKPSNIKRTPDGRIVLVDFGVAKYQTDFNTQVGARAFTSGYSPIEQYTGGTDVRSDIYALGATIYTLLTDVKPPDSLTMVGGRTFASPRKLNPEISRNTEKMILRAMQLQAADRYQSIHEMREAIGTKRITSFITERRPPPITHRLTEQQVYQPPRRSWFWPGLAALIGLILIIVVVEVLPFFVAEPPPTTQPSLNPPAQDTATMTPSETPTETLALTVSTAVAPMAPITLPNLGNSQSNRNFMQQISATATASAQETAAANLPLSPTLIITWTPTLTPNAPSPPTPTSILQPTATPPPTQASTATATPTATPRPRPTDTPTTAATPSPLATPTFTPAPTATSIPTASNTPTARSTPTASNTPTNLPTATSTMTPTPLATATTTNTPTPVTPVAGATQINPTDQATYVFVPAGPFTMGSTDAKDEQPVHSVTLQAFWMMRTEVTNAQYARCVAANVCTPPANPQWNDPTFADHPVTNVNWTQASQYATWAGGRLPTEAEWEKAAHGPDQHLYPWGEQEVTNQLLNYNFGKGATTPVGSYPAGASPYGVVDMAGNVEEWVADWYADGYYATSPAENPTGPAQGTFRVVRGGSYNSPRLAVRTTARGKALPNSRFDAVGFRIVR